MMRILLVLACLVAVSLSGCVTGDGPGQESARDLTEEVWSGPGTVTISGASDSWVALGAGQDNNITEVRALDTRTDAVHKVAEAGGFVRGFPMADGLAVTGRNGSDALHFTFFWHPEDGRTWMGGPEAAEAWTIFADGPMLYYAERWPDDSRVFYRHDVRTGESQALDLPPYEPAAGPDDRRILRTFGGGAEGDLLIVHDLDAPAGTQYEVIWRPLDAEERILLKTGRPLTSAHFADDVTVADSVNGTILVSMDGGPVQEWVTLGPEIRVIASGAWMEVSWWDRGRVAWYCHLRDAVCHPAPPVDGVRSSVALADGVAYQSARHADGTTVYAVDLDLLAQTRGVPPGELARLYP